MKYIEKDFLLCRGVVDQAAPEEVPVFMVGVKHIASWDDNFCKEGNDSNYLFPAFEQETGRGFLLISKWNPAEGYCSAGTDERLISFEEGIRLLCERGLYPWFSQE